MENSFFSGSENLYKYLVSIGLLMIVLSIYYPLKESQDLQVMRIKLKSEFNAISHEIDQNQKKVDELKIDIKSGKLSESVKHTKTIEIRNKTNLIIIKQIRSQANLEEVETRRWYVIIYLVLVVLFLPTGVILTWWGFKNWKKAKKNEDEKSDLEKQLLQIQVRNAAQTDSQSST